MAFSASFSIHGADPTVPGICQRHPLRHHFPIKVLTFGLYLAKFYSSSQKSRFRIFYRHHSIQPPGFPIRMG